MPLDKLPEPPPDFALALPIAREERVRFFRIHRRSFSPVYFDRGADSRFNAPDGSFGVLYASCEEEGAFAETLLRSRRRPSVTLHALQERAMVELVWPRPLRLIDFAGPGLVALGLDNRLADGDDYALAQRWAQWLHLHPEGVDGIRYRARQAPHTCSVALFERVGAPTVVSPRRSMS